MSIILAESVAVAKSKLTKGFNGDSLNLDGRVVSVDGADKGFKAAGNVKPPYTAVISSSNCKGFANGAVTAFNDYVKNINDNIGESQQLFNSYFADMKAVADKCEIPDSYLSIGAVTVYDNCVVAAKSGNIHLLRYSGGELFEAAVSEQDGGIGYQLIENVRNGDIFALISDEAAEDLDYDGIMNIFESGNELKTMVGDFFKLLPVNKGKDCTVVLIRLKVKEDIVASPVAAVLAADDVADTVADAEQTDIQDDEYELQDFATQQKNKLGKKKMLGLIPIFALIVVIAVAVGVYVANNFNFNNNEDSSDDIPAYMDSTDDETTTEIQSESNTSDTETTTEEETTTEAETTESSVTESPVTTTQAPETTTKAPETTTQAPETTTKAPETTTQAPETTTQPPETTTKAPETTTKAPETTTELPTQTPPDWWDIDEPYYGV